MAALQIRNLDQLDPFSRLNRDELGLVARHSRRLLIPAGRWLLRPGRVLCGQHFLLKGSVTTYAPSGVISAGEPPARKALYPGVGGLRTRSECTFLQVPSTVFELLELDAAGPAAVVGETADCWQSRFLGSELMRSLSPAIWQRLLSSLRALNLSRGDSVIHEGDQQADRCFVLAAGAAEVLRDGRLLNRLAPGDLFGEDALITGAARNASVRMATDGQVMEMAAGDFRSFLISALHASAGTSPPVEAGSKRTLIRFASSRDLHRRIALLPPERAYLVSSSVPEVESLAVFLMRKRGLVACAAAGGSEVGLRL